MSDYLPPKNHVFVPSGADDLAVESFGASPWARSNELADLIRVRFDSSGRRYSYWAPPHLPFNVRWAKVYTPDGRDHVVEILDRQLAYGSGSYKAIDGWYEPATKPEPLPVPPPPILNTTLQKQEKPVMGIKIEDKKFVNGKDIKSYSEEALYELLSESQRAIESLEKLPGNSKKVARQIAELKKAQEELVALIDAGESDEAAQASSAE